MKKILKSLIFPAISILIIAIIYTGLSIENLNNQTKALQKQNQTNVFNTNDLQNKLGQLQSEVDQTKALARQAQNLNDSLKQSLTSAQKQIYALQSGAKTTTTLATAEPITITKTVTQTIDRLVVSNQAAVIIDGVGNYRIDLKADDTAFDVLMRANNLYGLNIKYYTYADMGAFITSINGITPDYSKTHQYWAFYYNGSSSKYGVSSVDVSQNDSIEMRLVTDY